MADVQRIPISIGQNQSTDVYVPFKIGYVAVDNPGKYWVHFTQNTGAYGYIWPQRFGAVSPPPIRGPGIVSITTKDVPAGQVAPGADTSLASITIWGEPDTPFELGGAQPPPPNPGQTLATLDTVAGDIQPVGGIATSAGIIGLAADAGHVHVGPTVDARLYGVKADGGITENGALINNAINAVASFGGGTVFLAPGGAQFYNFTTTILMQSSVRLVGAGKQATYLKYDGSGTAIGMLNGQTAIPTATQYTELADLTLLGNPNALIGVDWYAAQLSKMSRIRVANFTNVPVGGAGIQLRGYRDATNPATASVACQLNELEFCEAYNCYYCLNELVTGAGADYYGAVNDDTFLACWFAGADNVNTQYVARLLERVANQRFVGCWFYHASAALVQVRDEDNIFDDCTAEFSAGDGYLLTGTSQRNKIVCGVAVASNIAGQIVNDQGTNNEKLGLSDGSAGGAPIWLVKGLFHGTGVGQFDGGVGNETVGHNHGHNHGSHSHSHSHGYNEQWGTSNTGPASAGTAHTHPYNDPSATGGTTSRSTTIDATATTPATDTTGESATHTHKG